MQNRENFLPFFLVFFSLSLLLIFLGKSGIINNLTSFTGNSLTPLRGSTFNFFSLKSLQNKQIESLLSENKLLRRQIVDKQNLSIENETLRNQFAQTSLDPQSLIPAKVIGAPGFIPGENSPQYLILDKGKSDGINVGDVVVLENNLVGKIVESFNDISKVMLIISIDTPFSAKSENQIQGIIKGAGGVLSMENVLLEEDLKKDTLILTKGEKDEKGLGYPPDLIVGSVISIEKESSELFQKAQVKSFIDFSNLTHVFILK